MFNRNAPALTKLEIEYLALVRALPCVCCRQYGLERASVAHHIKDGNRRMGHRFVLPLCPGHHAGEWVAGEEYGLMYSVHRNHRKFQESFGTEHDLWAATQRELGLPTTGWPASKLVPRRISNLIDWA